MHETGPQNYGGRGKATAGFGASPPLSLSGVCVEKISRESGTVKHLDVEDRETDGDKCVIAVSW